MPITKKQRMGIVVSALWFIVVFVGAVGDATVLLVFAGVPLSIAWGIWWIRRAKS